MVSPNSYYPALQRAPQSELDEKTLHPELLRQVPLDWNPRPASPRLISHTNSLHHRIEPIGVGGAKAYAARNPVEDCNRYLVNGLGNKLMPNSNKRSTLLIVNELKNSVDFSDDEEVKASDQN